MYGAELLFVVQADAEHEAVSSCVAQLPVHAQVIITGGIVDFDVYPSVIVVTSAFHDSKDSRHVLLVKSLIDVSFYQASFTCCRVANQDNLDVQVIRYFLLCL